MGPGEETPCQGGHNWRLDLFGLAEQQAAGTARPHPRTPGDRGGQAEASPPKPGKRQPTRYFMGCLAQLLKYLSIGWDIFGARHSLLTIGTSFRRFVIVDRTDGTGNVDMLVDLGPIDPATGELVHEDEEVLMTLVQLFSQLEAADALLENLFYEFGPDLETEAARGNPREVLRTFFQDMGQRHLDRARFQQDVDPGARLSGRVARIENFDIYLLTDCLSDVYLTMLRQEQENQGVGHQGGQPAGAGGQAGQAAGQAGPGFGGGGFNQHTGGHQDDTASAETVTRQSSKEHVDRDASPKTSSGHDQSADHIEQLQKTPLLLGASNLSSPESTFSPRLPLSPDDRQRTAITDNEILPPHPDDLLLNHRKVCMTPNDEQDDIPFTAGDFMRQFVQINADKRYERDEHAGLYRHLDRKLHQT
jgi:hypothetical protein